MLRRLWDVLVQRTVERIAERLVARAERAFDREPDQLRLDLWCACGRPVYRTPSGLECADRCSRK